MFFQVGTHRNTFSLTCHHCLRELFSTVIGIETFWQRSKTSIAIWHSIFFNSIPKQMVSIQLAKAKPENCGKIGLSFPLHNFISKKKNWPSVSSGYFHRLINIIMVVSLWCLGTYLTTGTLRQQSLIQFNLRDCENIYSRIKHVQGSQNYYRFLAHKKCENLKWALTIRISQKVSHSKYVSREDSMHH